jgi:molecular chaperone Hsp33
MRSDMAAHSAYAGADLLRPFHLERSQLRGRAVRLGDTVDYVLRAHDYPGPVSDLLGELLVLAGALAGGLKFDGTFSLQARGDGPVRLLVADCTNDGQMRGYAGYDEAAVAAGAGTGEGGAAAPVQLLGNGLLALTVDQRATGGEAYQGIVDLEGPTLSDCMSTYFERSEQVPTAIRTALGRDPLTDRWQAGAIMVQATPGSRPGDSDAAGDHWDRTRLMLGTATDIELLDPAFPLDDLLFRLFHEDGVRVFQPMRLAPGCGCDADRVRNVLRSFAPDELAEMRQDDGGVTATCQFCSRTYRFDRDEVDALLSAKPN